MIPELFNLKDDKNAAFMAGLIPNIRRCTIIGARTPDLRKLAHTVARDGRADDFVHALPHTLFEENQLHAFIISNYRDFDMAVTAVERFLPYVDNWATCDQMSPRVFAKHTSELLPYIKRWIQSGHTYTVRFAISMLMRFYLDDKFSATYCDMVARVRSDEYYINMMRAWYFATALAKQRTETLRYLTQQKLDTWTHNKTIRKAIESRRISNTDKQFLRTLVIK